MKYLNFFCQYANILSLDVVAGAVVSALFLSSFFSVSPDPVSLVALGITVWITYTIDHLRDALTIPNVASTDRHRFHQRHFRTIFGMLLVAIVGDFILFWFLSVPTLRAGLVLGTIVVLYLVVQRHLKFMKEFFVASLYTLGILLPSLGLMEQGLMPVHYLVIAKFVITAMMNLLLFSLFDYREDREHQHHSFVTWFGPRSTRIGILALGLLNIVSGLWLWEVDGRAALVFILMNVSLLGILFLGRRVGVNNYYRILGDAVFLIPGIYLI